jgi:hypothetical protein
MMRSRVDFFVLARSVAILYIIFHLATKKLTHKCSKIFVSI